MSNLKQSMCGLYRQGGSVRNREAKVDIVATRGEGEDSEWSSTECQDMPLA